MKRIGSAATLLVVVLVLGVCASAASADPLSMTFTEARANVGKQLSDEALFAAPDSAPFSAQVDPLSGAISSGTLGVPDFETHISEPIEADVTVDFDIGQITGGFDQSNGALSLTGEAGGTLTASGNPTYEGEQCTVLAEPSPITLTTAGSSGGTTPRSGTAFANGLAGSGAIAGEWQNMSAEPVEPGVAKNENFCESVENRIGGPGGIWLEQEDHRPPAPTSDNHPAPNRPPLPSPAIGCVVPKLTGKSLQRAKAALKAAHCKLGAVHKPKRHKGQRQPLVVKSSSPKAGAEPADGTVDLRLRPNARRSHR